MQDMYHKYFEDFKLDETCRSSGRQMTEADTRISIGLPRVHTFDFDREEFYSLLRETFSRMRGMGCDYYKLDFLDGALGKMGEPKKSVPARRL